MACATSAYLTPPNSLQRLETLLIGLVLAKIRRCYIRMQTTSALRGVACMHANETIAHSVFATGELLDKRRSAHTLWSSYVGFCLHVANSHSVGQPGEQGAFPSNDIYQIWKRDSKASIRFVHHAGRLSHPSDMRVS
jgi:hypothetical protein